ncbi:Phosphatidylinositol synthase, partial [Globisporangium splendens]
MAATKKQRTPTDVFFYVPNLIGYLRVGLTAFSLAIALQEKHYKTSIVCYLLSFVCDYFDGFFARWFDQCSNFGAVLDMVTDRCSTAGLLVILSHLYPDYLLAFVFLLVLDFSSHWYHMYASKGHHKTVAAERNWLLRVYYGNYPFFGYCCVGTEVFYILLYVLHFNPTALIPLADVPLAHLCYYVCFPACVLKNLINVAQLSSAAHSVAVDDVNTANKSK